jgi:hypothetical protein
MFIFEFDSRPEDVSQGKLMALAQFLLGRASDTNAQKQISVPAFVKLAHSMGISITPDRLIDLAGQAPLNNVIQNIENDKVVFKGATKEPDTMDTGQAEKVVAQMAKRASSK